MFNFGLITDLLSRKSLSGTVSEPVAVLFFGITLFVLTAGLRMFFAKRERDSKMMFQDFEKSGAVQKSETSDKLEPMSAIAG